MTNIASVTGTDGIPPVYKPDERWCSWNIKELWNGTFGSMDGTPGSPPRYVPKVSDYVEDTELKVTYVVTDVDPTTLLSTLVQVRTYGVTDPLSQDDILFGVGPGTQSDTYRVYLDKSVTPFVFAVDVRLKVAGTMTSYAKIFKGTNVGPDGKVVSFLYDQSGNYLTQNVPLELAAIDSHDNHAIKTVSVCYTNENLVDGELVTVVFYSATGHVVSKRQLLVENTSFIRSISSGQKYVSGISLRSPFLSTVSDHLLNYPLNVPVANMNMFGIVHYSDGSSIEMPVDGTKFKLHGLENYISTVVGQQLRLVLSYKLDQSETVYGAVTSDGKYVTEPYSLTTIVQQGAYTVKLFAYPVWIDSINGYRLRWFMYNLDRNIFFEVTNLVSYNSGTPSFSPIGYGILQKLSVRLNLSDVSGSYNSYIHNQNVDIVLRAQGTQRITNWTVSVDPNQPVPFGEDVYARASIVNQNLWNVKVDMGMTTQAQWLDKLYYGAKPIKDNQREELPPTPNYFIIQVGNQTYDFPIEAWNNELTVGSGIAINDTLIIRFIKRTASSDIQLVVAGMPIYNY